ncbi:MAG: hypothetical protein QOG62_1590 [Thermoleophilaceae bacterium]|nr:hypothetical protein [Thermoleophilaceae bacterium]
MVRPRRPALVNICPVCTRPVTERDERSRLRGRTYVHRSCATYEVRSLGAVGVYPSHPSRGIPAAGSLAE